MIAATSGGLGDIVYAIPTMRKLNIDTLYVKESYYYPPYGNLYLSCKRFMESQGFKIRPTSGAFPPYQYEPGITFDYDLDQARTQRNRGRNHIMISYLNQFNLPHDDWKQPWIKVEGDQWGTFKRRLLGKYSIIHRTSRWRRNSVVNWAKVVRSIKDSQPIFVGFKYEHDDFCREIGFHIHHIECEDILDMANLIYYSEALYCNQSVSLTLAQGLGKPHYLDRNPGKTNCLMNTPNEHLL